MRPAAPSMRSALVDRSRPWEGLSSTGEIFGDKIPTMTKERMIARRVALDLDTCTWHRKTGETRRK
jgi:hypothetical protein